MRPVVSVIVPTFNRAALVREAIDSVLAQTFTSYEIIVVDDGSTDDTASVTAVYGDRLRYVYTERGGVAHARNVGVRHAAGRYLTFLDSDDRLYPYALELQVALLERFPAVGMACAEMSGFDDAGFFERYHLRTYHQSSFRDSSQSWHQIYAESHRLGDMVVLPSPLLDTEPGAGDRRVYLGNVFDTYLQRLVLCQNSVMLRREVIDDVGARNEQVRHWQEVDYLLRVTRRYPVCFADVPTYQLRYHDGQISMGSHFTWMRKQQILLRVVRRHAEADPAYYAAHRVQLDEQLARLHRAVAVPMLLQAGSVDARRRYARRARVHLERAARYGHPFRWLYLAAHLPPPIARHLVSIVETVRGWQQRRQRRTAAGIDLV